MKRRQLLAVLGLAALAACSALKFSYNRLDWIAAWQVGRFVDLEPLQERLLDEHFDTLWQWHRSTQLALYAQDLRELAGRAERPLTAAQVEEFLDRGQGHLGRLLQAMAPDSARLLQSFDDAQVAELLDSLAERRRDKAEESAVMTDEDIREQAEEQMLRQLKRWIGSPTREQKTRVRKWSLERAYAGTIWQQYQEAWAKAFAETLEHRREPDFAQRLATFDHGRVPYDEAMAKVQLHNRQAWIGLMADLSTMLTREQRRHLQETVRELADDLTELAGTNPQAAPAGSGGPNG